HFADLNNDGKINSSDQKIIGNGLPKGEGSLIDTFNYKNFQLVVNLQFEYGNQVDWPTRYELLDRTGIANSFSEVLNAWTPNHQNTNIAQIRPDAGYKLPAQNKSSWIFNGSFIRGKRILFAYHFPQNMIKKWNLKNLRVYIAADNLFLITKYPGFDPEVSQHHGGFNQGVDQFAYPKSRIFQFGLNFSL
ncbi:MAG TPA: SusC/RagA family TonB-linked outer membrane protein, partial [Bacteroidales bacterium]|nr:SusC/RagA family TonB-linked outer membrane protein [Bacteroidales bacterium]